ncbi:hypothetical protein [Gimesia aquarii]|uniref:Uncharacterized protein n=1 Tax=Gimesia aquarii TaxID=2527964 RepID=A0A517X2Z8_9PLAN|nr:hypothetical protein [Gimesia aquarii]QDU11886.1 hypothetical protein V202x_53110 [Gimesia aquarii]
MKQAFFLILVFYTSDTILSASEQYLLRVDTVGYINSTEGSPKETVLNSIEVISRPNEIFRCKVQTGKDTQIMSGKLFFEDGEFSVKIHYTCSVENGTIVSGKPLLDRTEVKSSNLKVVVGKSTRIGGMNTIEKKPSLPPTKTGKHLILSLSQYEPASE